MSIVPRAKSGAELVSETLAKIQSGPAPERPRLEDQPSGTQRHRIHSDADTQADSGLPKSSNEIQRVGGADVDAPAYEKRERRFGNDNAAWYAAHADDGWNDYLVAAWRRWHELISDEIEPEWKGLFWFIYLIRGHKSMDNVAPKQAFDTVTEQLRRWSNSTLKDGKYPPFASEGNAFRDPWSDWMGIPKADAKPQFIAMWAQFRYHVGKRPLDQARDLNRQTRCLLSDDVFDKRGLDKADRRARAEDDYEFFVGFAGYLQTVAGDQPIMLPCREVGELLGVNKNTVSIWRRWAIEDGYLTIFRPHAFRGAGKKNDATEFRFDTGRWSALRKLAQPEGSPHSPYYARVARRR